MHRNSWQLFDRHAAPLFCGRDHVLEIGPEGFPSTYQRRVDVATWDTMDITNDPQLTYKQTDLYQFPVENCKYDVVISGQVIEHVAKIWKWMPEVARVTRPGGLVITIAPITWPYHEAPIDCWRLYPAGITALYEDAGLEVLLARWESIEVEQIARHLPTRLRSKALWQRASNTILALNEHLRLPLQASFDTIAIGRKPS